MHLIRTGALMGYTDLVSKLGHNPILLLQKVGLTPGQLREYLSWEVELINQIQRDGTTNFRHYPDKHQ